MRLGKALLVVVSKQLCVVVVGPFDEDVQDRKEATSFQCNSNGTSSTLLSLQTEYLYIVSSFPSTSGSLCPLCPSALATISLEVTRGRHSTSVSRVDRSSYPILT